MNALEQDGENIQVSKEEIQKGLDAINLVIKQIEQERDNAIEEANKSKDDKLAEIPKQNIFQRALGAISSKINGTKTFVRSVVQPLKDKIATLRDTTIPNIKQGTKNKINATSKFVGDKINGAKEKVGEGISKANTALKNNRKNKLQEKQMQLEKKKAELEELRNASHSKNSKDNKNVTPSKDSKDDKNVTPSKDDNDDRDEK